MSQKEIVREYTNGEVTVVWRPRLCMHSTICFNGLPEVFDPNARPWINMEGAETERLIEQVKKCPSGALSFYRNGEEKKEVPAEPAQRIEVSPGGPLLVHGNITISMPDGSEQQKERMTALCRCGASANKPFCDGSHRKIGFKG